MTLGEAGALLHSAEESVLVPAFDCGRVVETAGAGDGFTGGFAAALARGESPSDAVRFGCAAREPLGDARGHGPLDAHAR